MDDQQYKAPRDYTIEVVDRAIQVLFALGTPQYIELSLKELSDSLEMKKENVFRILWNLQRRQLVEEIDGKWRIGPAMTRFSEGFKRYVANRRGDLARMIGDHTGCIEFSERKKDDDE